MQQSQTIQTLIVGHKADLRNRQSIKLFLPVKVKFYGLNYFLIVLEMEKSVFLLEQIIVWEEKVKRKQVNLELL